jgi:SH3-like domain-containing protein
MEQRGKFILMTLPEFAQWLDNNSFSRTIRLIQNHHTYIPGYAHFRGNNHFSMLTGMENAHLQRGFNEIAQNLTTFPDGRIAVCRNLNKIPGGIKGANTYGICMEHIGNFDTGGDAMTAAHADAILEANALLCKKFSLTPSSDTVVYHHWWDLNSGLRTNGSGATKSCPGTNFFGGNKVADAEANFIPRVAALINRVPAAPAVLWEGLVNANSLNVRSGADANASVLRSLTRSTPVLVYEESNGWLRIHPSRQEWVSGRYITRNQVPVAIGQVEITASTLRVRNAPDGDAPILHSLAQGNRTAYYESQNGWLRVHAYQSEWIAERYTRVV